MNMHLIRFYYRVTRFLRSLLPANEREFLEAVEQIGTDQALEEMHQEWSRRKVSSNE